MLHFFILIIISWLSLLANGKLNWHYHQPEKLFSISGLAQGTTYSIKYSNRDSLISKFEIDSILTAIDKSLSLYLSTSLISTFNTSAKGSLMDYHMKKVVEKAIEYNFLSKGYFDITVKPLSDLWGFGLKPSNNPPSDKQIKTALQYVGVNMLYFKNDSLLKRNPKTEIDCNGIAQGYSVDVLCDFLNKKKITNYIVELGGEIKTSGTTEKGLQWLVGIENPTSSYGEDYLVNKKIAISNLAVTTSGSYRKFKKYGTKYFTHIINPLVGKPLDNKIISVTVIAKNAMEADALDNVFTLLGIRSSFELVEHLSETGLYIVYQNSAGEIRDTSNQFFKAHLVSY